VFASISDNIDIIWIYTIPEFRKAHNASELIKWLQEKYVKPIFVEVHENNTPAIALYKKMAFVKINVRKNYYAQNNASLMVYKPVR
jgi:ribosomal protein S18 acetylase RimI-like enzyme